MNFVVFSCELGVKSLQLLAYQADPHLLGCFKLCIALELS
jgi:hypothetical protein